MNETDRLPFIGALVLIIRLQSVWDPTIDLGPINRRE